MWGLNDFLRLCAQLMSQMLFQARLAIGRLPPSLYNTIILSDLLHFRGGIKIMRKF